MSRVVTLIGLLLLAISCTTEPYQPHPISIDASTRYLRSQLPDHQDFATFLADQGIGSERLPLKAWDIQTIGQAARFFHTDLNVARAQWQAAVAAEITASLSPLPKVSSLLESSTNENGGPWSYGLAIEIPIETNNKKQLRIDRAKQLSEAAKIQIAHQAWRVEHRARLSYVDFVYAKHVLTLLEKERDIRQDILHMMEARLDHGMVSSVEVSQVRLHVQKNLQTLADQKAQIATAHARLAADCGLTLEAFERLPIESSDMPRLIPLQRLQSLRDSLGVQAQDNALLNRLDLRSALVKYAAAESKLRLEIARQIPDIVIGPGYRYEQGDHVWSLGWASLLTASQKNRGLIAEATQLRALEAAEFEALQARIIGEIAQEQQTLAGTIQESEVASNLLDQQNQRLQQIQQQVTAGHSDRMSYRLADLESTLAELQLVQVNYKIAKSAIRLENAMQKPLWLE